MGACGKRNRRTMAVFLYRTVFFQDNNETGEARKCPARKEKAA
jgi:hypothetical protein